MDCAAHLTVLDELLTRPLPGASALTGLTRLTGPAGAGQEPAAELRRVVDALTRRWGAPMSVAAHGVVDPTLYREGWHSLSEPFGDRLAELAGWAVRGRLIGCGLTRGADGPALVAVVRERADPALLAVPQDALDGSATWTDRLQAVTGWTGPAARAVDWPSVHTLLGTTLPADYRQLIDRFGPGSFDGYVRLLVPGAESQHPDEVDAGRLLRWADTEQGDTFYWLADAADPDDWPVLARGEDEWYRFDGPAGELVQRLLTDPRHPGSIAGLIDEHFFEPDEPDKPDKPERA